MAYMKHPTEGNEHVPDAEVEARKASGWVAWPRSLSEKLGYLPPSVLAVERKKPGPKPKHK